MAALFPAGHPCSIRGQSVTPRSGGPLLPGEGDEMQAYRSWARAVRGKQPWQLLRDERGSQSIEFAGATLVFALVLIFILQAGAMMTTQVTAANAAREVARAAVSLPPGDVEAALRRAAPANMAREMNVESSGDSVRVTVRLQTPLIFDAVRDWNWWVQGTATMRRER